MLRPLIGPSLLASDLSNLFHESKRVLAEGADYLHLDVMDGHFVPNMTFGAPVISCLRKNLDRELSVKPCLDVHLMVTHPELWLNDMAAAGANIFTFHVEVDGGLLAKKSLISSIKNLGMQVGIALRPSTPLQDVLPYLDDVDQVLVMTVEPGFGGQAFMPETMDKVRQIRQMRPTLNIQVDGGLSPSTVDIAAAAGANMIVAGSAIFKHVSPREVMDQLRDNVQKHLHAGPAQR